MTDARMQGRFWPDTQIPRRPDGSVDVLAVCRWLDEQANVTFQQVNPYPTNTSSGRMVGGPGAVGAAPALAESSEEGPTT